MPLSEEKDLLDTIRLSIGTAAILGLVQCRLDAIPTTAYTMTYTQSRCAANCAFCAQARDSSAKANQLSRVTWPSYALDQFIDAFTVHRNNSPFRRLCIQTLCYPNLVNDLMHLISLLKSHLPKVPLSIALPPLSADKFKGFYNQGVDRVAVSLDAITANLFNNVKGAGVNGPFSWDMHIRALESARSIFGSNRTTTHLIIGLGETEYQAVHLIQSLIKKGIRIGLFPFTPITGTLLAKLNRPALGQYRRIQLAHYLLQEHLISIEQMQFSSSNQLMNLGLSKEVLIDIIARGKAFQTSGCPSCNRPFFTEQPGGPIYNYPMPPTEEALKEIKSQLAGVL
jgi:biotin synthase-related radical SAM superfamily protein